MFFQTFLEILPNVPFCCLHFAGCRACVSQFRTDANQPKSVIQLRSSLYRLLRILLPYITRGIYPRLKYKPPQTGEAITKGSTSTFAFGDGKGIAV